MKRFWLAGIVLLAFLLRTVYLSRFPVGFNADEASFGYDAYSIFKTGKDQWGNFMPLVLKSFGDYKPPLYSYLTIPSLAAFGLNKFAVRLPNALVGTAAVFVLYLLVETISRKRSLAFLAAFLLAISPWHIMLSRGAFESNLTTLFLPLGVYLFLIKRYFWASLVLGLNLFGYHSAKLVTPLTFLALLFFTKTRKVLPIVVFSVFFLFMLYSFKLGGGTRAAERSIFVGALEAGAKEKIELIQKGANPVLARLLHNKYQVVARRFLLNYSQYFSKKFLLESGTAESTYGMIPGLGLIYAFEGILLLGIIPLFVLNKRFRGMIAFFLFWLMVAPVPAALATGAGYSGNRAAGMVPVLQILAALGLAGYAILLKKADRKILRGLVGMLAVLLLWQSRGFMKAYFGSQTSGVEKGMLAGNLEMAKWLADQGEIKKVIISRSFSEPQIFIAFAQKWSPADYQKSSKSWEVETWVDQIPSYSLGNYTFKSIDWRQDGSQKGTILVARPEDFPKNLKPDMIFEFTDKTPAFYVKQN